MTKCRPGLRESAAWLVLGLLVSSCASPIGVQRVNPRAVLRQLTADYLSAGELSLSTQNYLRRVNLSEAFADDPETALVLGHALLRERSQHGREAGTERLAGALVALAEMSFSYASASGDERYFLAAAVYAWAYLFPKNSALAPHPLDPRLRLAANIYNRSVTLAFTNPATNEFELRAQRRQLPFGSIDIRLDPAQLRWGERTFTRFTPLADFEIRGLRNRYHQAGLGAPLGATTDWPEGSRPAEDPVFSDIQVSVAALLVFEGLRDDVAPGQLKARFEVHTAADHVEIEGRVIPMELEPTAALALTLTETAPWRREIAGFFQGDLSRTRDGLESLAPYQPGKIPVVLVHGTASSSGRWADFLNDLAADPRIRDGYQFWFYTYNTGAPIAYSGWLLRMAIQNMIDVLDPESRDPALRRMVVIGHSQGGLLTKLTAVESGDVFWHRISDRPIDELDLSEENRRVLEGALFVEPLPAVERVIFIATPHRGSYLAAYGPAKLLARLARTPANVASVVSDLATQDDEGFAIRRLGRVEGAIGNMSPGSDFIQDLASLDVASGIRRHSIIPVTSFDSKADASDGVVRYESAHIEPVDSEVVVFSGHSCQSHPMVIEEAHRILLDHLAASPRGVAQPQ